MLSCDVRIMVELTDIIIKFIKICNNRLQIRKGARCIRFVDQFYYSPK